ncbi:MAG: flagellar FlbD family protein [Brevinemataceae bacterium]
MIELTRLNNSKISINPYQVEMIESNPDTVIVMNSGKKYLVKEDQNIIEKKFSNFLAGSFYKALVKANIKLNSDSKP